MNLIEIIAGKGKPKDVLIAGFSEFEGDPQKDIDFISGRRKIGSLKMCSLHEPMVRLDGDVYDRNLADNGKIGEQCYLNDLNGLKLAQDLGIPFVFHGGYYNAYTSCREKSLDFLAERLGGIFKAVEGPTLHIEVDAYTPLKLGLHEANLVTADNFLYLFKALKKEGVPEDKVRVIFDVNHLYISPIFMQNVDDLRRTYRKALEYFKIDEEVDLNPERSRPVRENKDFLNFLAEVIQELRVSAKLDPDRTLRESKEHVEDFFQKLSGKIGPIFHVCGYDPFRNTLKERGHLPVGYKGKIGELYVEDQVDHKHWVSLARPYITEDTRIVLEFDYRDSYDFVDQLVKSRENLIGQIGEVI